MTPPVDLTKLKHGVRFTAELMCDGVPSRSADWVSAHLINGGSSTYCPTSAITAIHEPAPVAPPEPPPIGVGDRVRSVITDDSGVVIAMDGELLWVERGIGRLRTTWSTQQVVRVGPAGDVLHIDDVRTDGRAL